MVTQVSLGKDVSTQKKKVLFLGYTREQTTLIDALVEAGCEVHHTDEKIQSTVGYDLVVSYGYRHIIKKQVLQESLAPIINLHISYLPWNRGAHPNFWSFFDCTPSGVTIHLMDEGIDTGPVMFQKYVNFSKVENTFSKTYKRLIEEIEQLFKENIGEIVSNTFVAIPQRRKGSYHCLADLPKEFSGWDSEIRNEVVRLDSFLNKK